MIIVNKREVNTMKATIYDKWANAGLKALSNFWDGDISDSTIAQIDMSACVCADLDRYHKKTITQVLQSFAWAYGYATNVPWKMGIFDATVSEYIYVHPTFFYESMACLLGFIIMLIVRRYKNLKVGHISALYFIIYGITRFFIESMRQDSLMLGSFKVAQLVSLGLVIIGALLFIKQMYSNKLYNSKEK